MFRNLARRKLRTALTIIGVTVGIWALMVMSAMANKLTAIVEGGSTYFDNKVVVSEACSRVLTMQDGVITGGSEAGRGYGV